MLAALLVLALDLSSAHLNFDDNETRGWRRGGLGLTPGQPGEFNFKAPLSTDAGTLAFWVLPDPPAGGSQSSYTLLSARWGAPADGYFAVSQGWWEPLGRGRFHAIISNQDAAFCITDRALQPRRWTHVLVSWHGKVGGSCRIYFDGELAASNPVHFTKPRSGRLDFALGSDRNATDVRGRDARGVLDELEYFPRTIGDAQARAMYQRAVPDARQRLRRTFEWAAPFRGSQATVPERETRALLDESWQWARSPADVRHLVDLARRAGFNIIIPCVWHGRGTAWPSEIEQPQSELSASLAKFDPLKTLIDSAHRVGIEVHPWFTVVRREDDRHPAWFDAGTPAEAYDVHDAEFRRFAIDLIGDVATRYEVDGINLDYIRAMGICRSASCARDYLVKTGRDLLADIAASTVRGPARDTIESWQDGALREMVAGISARVRATRPGAKITVSGHPVPAGTLRALEGRAELEWRRRGLIDGILSMEYGAVPRHEIMAAVAAELGEPAALTWVIANFDRLDGHAVARPADHLAEYIHVARERVPGSGIAVYLRAMLNDGQVAALSSGPFRQRVTPRWPASHPP